MDSRISPDRRARMREMLAGGGADARTLARFDAVVSRRRFVTMVGRGGALAALATLGVSDVAARGLLGRGLLPAAWAQDPKTIPDKPAMIVHNTRPINGEFPAHMLDDSVTPTERHFVRNNGLVPERAEKRDVQGWTLTVDGEVHTPLTLTLDDLMKMPAVTFPALIECGGNGRGLFDPKVRGNQWGQGAVACSEWTGVRLRDILQRAGLKPSAVYTGHYGEDPPIGKAQPFSRGVPIAKAMEEHTLVAYRMNGTPLDPLNGFPVRLVVPGWIGSCSQKWLTRVRVRDTEHDAEKMLGYSYRVPAYPVVPGKIPPKEDMVVATAWVVKSMITTPAAEAQVRAGDSVPVRGHAWAGENRVARVRVSTDYGETWTSATVKPGPSKYAWARWETAARLPGKGYHEIWAQAVDDTGDAQPLRQPWNPRGYLGNVVHRVGVVATA
jgi:DMSO/TMAO reductase YedYZ molybdopterin-dependent catalytic subunit